MLKFVNLFGFDISINCVSDIVTHALKENIPTIVNTINPHSYIEQKNDNEFHEALAHSHVLIPDGSGIVLAARQIRNLTIKKIAGFDLFQETLIQLNESNGRVFFLGSSQNVLNLIEKKMKLEFPNIQVSFLSPPYKPSFNEFDIYNFISSINNFQPDAVFVGLTAPKQEKLIYSIYQSLDVKMISGIGAVFDFYAGTIKRPNKLWLVLHLEWLIRFIGEPRRLWRRNFISTPLFLIDLVKEKLNSTR